jgi:hypothetical protein
MACRRFARPWSGELAVTRIKSISIAIVAVAAAMTLAGCVTAPLTVEEQLFFDKATGSGILGPPGLRLQNFGYAPPVGRVYRLQPPPDVDEP